MRALRALRTGCARRRRAWLASALSDMTQRSAVSSLIVASWRASRHRRRAPAPAARPGRAPARARCSKPADLRFAAQPLEPGLAPAPSHRPRQLPACEAACRRCRAPPRTPMSSRSARSWAARRMLLVPTRAPGGVDATSAKPQIASQGSCAPGYRSNRSCPQQARRGHPWPSARRCRSRRRAARARARRSSATCRRAPRRGRRRS